MIAITKKRDVGHRRLNHWLRMIEDYIKQDTKPNVIESTLETLERRYEEFYRLQLSYEETIQDDEELDEAVKKWTAIDCQVVAVRASAGEYIRDKQTGAEKHVHRRSDIADSIKFLYIISVLSGAARSTVEGLPVTSGYRLADAVPLADILGKRTARDLMALGSPGNRPRCLFFVQERKYGMRFLVDSGLENQRASIQHHILTHGLPVFARPRRLPPDRLELARKEFDILLSIIRPSNSSWASPLHMVRKKQPNTWRSWGDYQRLNNVTKPGRYPIPNFNDFVTQLSGRTIFSKVSLIRAYQQIPVAEEIPKAAITTSFSLYEYEVLDRLRKVGLKVKPEKCQLMKRKVAYLGHIISEKGIATDPSKTRAVKEWQAPSCVSELRQLLGLASYYRKFVNGFASIAAPLHQLQEGDAEWKWTKVCQAAFDALKHQLTSASILAYSDFRRRFLVDVDASGDGLGAVLSQKDGSKERVVAYASRSLTKPERCYCVTRREMLGLKPILLARDEWGRPLMVPHVHAVCGEKKAIKKQPRTDAANDCGLSAAASGMDILGPLEKTPSGNRYVLVLTDYFTKWTAAFPLTNMEADTVAKVLMEKYIAYFRAPDCLHSDQGRSFEARVVQELCRLFDIRKTRSSPYHPQGNGQAERFNRTLLDMLSIMCEANRQQWDEMFSCVMLAYSSSVNESTGVTLAMAMFGRELQLPLDIQMGSPQRKDTETLPNYIRQTRERIDIVHEQMRRQLKVQQRRQKSLYDRKATQGTFCVKDLVWLAILRGGKLHPC
ncbi:Retrovirus-related Pol polyprotein from transposon opus [Trichinella spiralis]|uniref:RNA-directed DNA polymerase n=1 Tax=Trichinella spiralis TaxID=6334 RepID=A0A0V1BHZ1_TRISP|nr:Retrovirus-related Pol polyprotein from transposon opus [Trichinella spiralis]